MYLRGDNDIFIIVDNVSWERNFYSVKKVNENKRNDNIFDRKEGLLSHMLIGTSNQNTST
jgi:hypothetical protein